MFTFIWPQPSFSSRKASLKCPKQVKSKSSIYNDDFSIKIFKSYNCFEAYRENIFKPLSCLMFHSTFLVRKLNSATVFYSPDLTNAVGHAAHWVYADRYRICDLLQTEEHVNSRCNKDENVSVKSLYLQPCEIKLLTITIFSSLISAVIKL